MALTRSSSVCARSMSIAFSVLLGLMFDARAFTGGLPDTYRAALPLPGIAAGNRRARTVESL